ncbi:hypothetical protein B5X24_HaOG210021 [Helicoverpa armigera]|nr:hypothetical protein B5X24_HaOG210021 [Helicoverpa armigera]
MGNNENSLNIPYFIRKEKIPTNIIHILPLYNCELSTIAFHLITEVAIFFMSTLTRFVGKVRKFLFVKYLIAAAYILPG